MPYLHLGQVVPRVLEVPVGTRADKVSKWRACAQGFLNCMSSRDLSVPSCPWGNPGPLNLLASTSNCYIRPCLDSTPNPTATSPTWGPSGPRYPFAPLTPRGEMSLFWKEMARGQQEQPCAPAALAPQSSSPASLLPCSSEQSQQGSQS